MAAAFFNASVDPAQAQAISAGTTPGTRVHPEVVAVMREVGIDLSHVAPQKLTAEVAQGAALLVTMGCGDQCPVVPGMRHDDWPLPDPKGQSLDTVRRIRDEVRERVAGLVATEGWEAPRRPSDCWSRSPRTLHEPLDGDEMRLDRTQEQPRDRGQDLG
jgi:arsenate reductase